jgi:basic membrane protein A
MYSIGGLGDGGYNDAILSGIQAFRKDYTNDIDLYHYSPTSEDEARRLLYDWLSRPESDIPALFIAAASDYDSLVVEALDSIPLTANKQMLMFESKRRNLPITTFSISMYGASFLAGITAAHCEGDSALVVLGSAQDETIKTAADGFTDGYAYAEPSKKVNIEYLADDWTGFSAAALAYSKMFDWAPRYSFIFPVAGGSNSGIYRYTREYPTASPYVAGMDTDQSELSNLLVGSLTKFIESIIYEHLYSWLMTGEMPESQTYGLRSGCVFWLVSPHYEDRFEQLVEDSYDVAVEREEAYYAE